MNSPMYTEIIATFLIPYMADHFEIVGGILHQDNDPKHTSHACTEILSSAHVRWIRAPAKSPDLNPIEMLWHSMQEFIRKRSCKRVHDVEMAVLDFIKSVSPEVCQNYIDKLPDIIRIVIKNKGSWS